MRPAFRAALSVFLLLTMTVSAQGQWLNRLTPDIPRAADGKPKLDAPAPRLEGRPDFSGVWVGQNLVVPVPDDALSPKSKALLHEREENYRRDRPAFQCRPSGPEPSGGWRRIVQTSSLITILKDDLSYRLIFLDGRKLESDPERTWM